MNSKTGLVLLPVLAAGAVRPIALGISPLLHCTGEVQLLRWPKTRATTPALASQQLDEPMHVPVPCSTLPHVVHTCYPVPIRTQYPILALLSKPRRRLLRASLASRIRYKKQGAAGLRGQLNEEINLGHARL